MEHPRDVKNAESIVTPAISKKAMLVNFVQNANIIKAKILNINVDTTDALTQYSKIIRLVFVEVMPTTGANRDTLSITINGLATEK